VRVDDLPLRDRLLIKTYQWRSVKPVPCAVLRKPLSASCVALVSTAGLVGPEHAPFDLSTRGGDVTFRVIASGVDPQALTVWHRSEAFDRAALTRDRNVAFPIDRLREMAAGGVIGAVAPRHLSFMGSITAPGRLRKETAPHAASLLVDDRVDVALLVPV
jgi:D-proline reductase (dithiol) PrdB